MPIVVPPAADPTRAFHDPAPRGDRRGEEDVNRVGARWRSGLEPAYNGGVEKVTAIGIMSAFAQPTRLQVFTMLARASAKGMSSGDLANKTGAAANTMSSHLAILNRAGLVTAEKAGRNIVYRAVPDTVRELTTFLLDACGN